MNTTKFPINGLPIKRHILSLTIVSLLIILLFSCSPQRPQNLANKYQPAVGMMMSDTFERLALSGKGIKVGIIDEGFFNFSDEATKNLNVKAYKNFVTGSETGFFTSGSGHGTNVARNLGGRKAAEIWGLAHSADYYLAVSEDATSETKEDERRLVKAINWMLDQGVRVINISLNYKKFDNPADSYTPADLYKSTSISGWYIDSVTKANPSVNFIISAGNYGMEKDKTIGTPADVQYAITVGSSNAKGDGKTLNSAEGLTGAPYIKPDVITWPNIGGTSFSAPAVAGLVAVMLEYRPNLTNREILKLLHASGNKAAAPDTKVGYGVPQTAKLLQLLR